VGSASRAKGKRGELESAKLWQKHGGEVRPLQSGQRDRDDAGDYLATLGGVEFVVQVRRREKVALIPASREVEGVARDGEVGCVVYRPNGEPWRISLLLDDFGRLVT